MYLKSISLLGFVIVMCFAHAANSQWTKATQSPLQLTTSFASANDRLLAACNDGIYRLDASGSSWEKLNTGVVGACYSIHTQGSDILASFMNAGVYRSTDAGDSWNASNQGLSSTKVRTLGSFGDTLFAGTLREGLFVSSDHGANWSSITNDLTAYSIMAIQSLGLDLFVATLESGLFRSSDGGVSWSACNAGIDPPKVGRIAEIAGDLAAGGLGMYRSTNLGASWTSISTGLDNINVRALAVHDNNLFVGTDGWSGLYISKDRGEQWLNISSIDMSGAYMNAIGVHGSNIYVATGPEVLIWRRPLADFANLSVAVGRAELDFNFSPNPTLGTFHLSTGSEQGLKISITDLLGRVVIPTFDVTSAESSVDVSTLPSGPYMVSVSGTRLRGTKLIIKQ
jgi:photosystem II stability/assembly factor-like uncharacterized protein